MKYVCGVCGYVYDEAAGIPEKGIPAGTKWEELSEDWVCPLCGANKKMFRAQGEPSGAASAEPEQKSAADRNPSGGTASQETKTSEDQLREMSYGELSAMCSNLMLGCEKQQLAREKELFGKLADYFERKAGTEADGSFGELLSRIGSNLKTDFPEAKQAAEAVSDRGVKRILTWSEKVTNLLSELLERYGEEGNGFISETNVYVCEICGFVYVGDTPPDICPICKVPSFKILKVERG